MVHTLDRASLKAQCRELLQTAQVSPKGLTALYCGLSLVLNLVDYAAGSFASNGGPELLSMFASVFTMLAGWILATGFALYCMGIRQLEIMDYGTLFDGFSFTGKIIALNFVMNFFICLWSMLFMIPGVIAYYRYRFALYNLCENPGLSVMEALDMSKRQTQGWKLELLKLDLSYLGWIVLSLLPALYVDGRLYLQVLSDPSVLLTASSSLTEIIVCGMWSLAVSLFFLPNYQCVNLDCFDAAKAAVSGGQPFRRTDGPDDLGGV